MKGLNGADVKKRLAEQGAEVIANSPSEFGAYFQKEITKWDSVVVPTKAPQ